jgi:ferredoxin
MGIDVARKEVVRDTRCNRCGECLASCPIKNGLDHSLPGKMKLSLRNRIITASLVIVFFTTPIVVSRHLGLFKTSENSVIIQGNLEAEDIKSSMTLTELAGGFGMDFLSLKEYLRLPEEVTGDVKLRDVEDYAEELTFKVIREKVKDHLQNR